DERAEPALIVNGTMLYHLDYRPTWIENVKPISGFKLDASGARMLRPDGDPAAIEKIGIWPTRAEALPRRGDIIQQQLFDRFAGKAAASALHGLKDAITEGGAARRRVGFDDPRIGQWLGGMGLDDMKTIDASNVFKEIRQVKTPAEIELLRGAAERNEAALLHAIALIEPGQTLLEIERNHACKWAELGGQARWLIANVNGVNSGIAERGDWMKLDSVGTWEGYHGDVGRTVVLGPPTDELARRIEADTKVSRIIYDHIRPGMLYIDICALFSDLMKDEGFDIAYAGPHDVGLEHTDHPVEVGVPDMPGNIPYSELRFFENTVFTLDMPHNEIGWGTTHVEDMMVVKADGCQPLSSMDTGLKIV
ncbi:M24 family metallopeptidase, partial [Polymorphobacter sp.]|uniref:M24 family metallopeptidase n=1 Tax=Polymorphobacter sp. TaxID=1909290 RepID=UPI003F6F720B